MRWHASLTTEIDGNREVNDLFIHKCDNNDLASFNPVVKRSKKHLDTLRDKQVLYCLDSFQKMNVEVYGEDESYDF